MNYLFFDIECASTINYVSRICSFGYFLCDESFNKIEKNDIIINPECDFDTEHLEKNGVIFAYPEEYFYKFPNFAYSFSEIRRLLTLPDTLIIGHSTYCDAAYIIQNCRRYGLKPFDFYFLDTQRLHAHIAGEMYVSLQHLCEIYDTPMLFEHKSDDDAEMTARCAQKICEKGGFTLIDAYHTPSLLGMVHDGVIHSSLSEAFPVGDGFNMTPYVKKSFRRYLESSLITKPISNALQGICYTFDENFEHKNFKTALWLVNELRLRGAHYTTNALECDVFVDFPAEAQKHGRRLISQNLHKKILTSDMLLNSLSISLPSPDNIDIDKILGGTESGIAWYKFYSETVKPNI